MPRSAAACVPLYGSSPRQSSHCIARSHRPTLLPFKMMTMIARWRMTTIALCWMTMTLAHRPVMTTTAMRRQMVVMQQPLCQMTTMRRWEHPLQQQPAPPPSANELSASALVVGENSTGWKGAMTARAGAKI